MPWVEIFAVFVVSHLVGDYMLQTEWQAVNKRGGLTGTAAMRAALVTHVATYTLAFVPAFVWLWSHWHAGVFWIAAAIALPHLIQDDGRLLEAYGRRVKRAELTENPLLYTALDQSFHILALFILAVLIGR